MNVKQVINSNTTAALGAGAFIAGILYPVVTLFTSRPFVTSLLFGTPAQRTADWQQIVVEMVVAVALMAAGALALWVGKGPFSPKPSSQEKGP